MRRSTSLRPRRRKLALAALLVGLGLGIGVCFNHGQGLQSGLINIPGGKCDLPDILVFAGFRSHLLIPHVTENGIIDDQANGQGVTKHGNEFYWKDQPFLRVIHHTHPGRVRVVVTALQDVWLQEPGLAVKIAGEGYWQGFGPSWSTDRYAVKQRNAYLSTIHFSRANGPRRIESLKYTEGGKCLTLYSDGGFEKLLDHPVRDVPWQGALVMGSPEGWELTGVYDNPNEILRRYELAGKPPNVSQMYFLGWTGGPGGIVNAQGRTPPPGTHAGPDYSLIYNPRSWRELPKGEQISETIFASAS